MKSLADPSKRPALIEEAVEVLAEIELGVTGGLQISECVALEAGYRLLWIDGVSLATDQVGTTNFLTGAFELEQGDYLIMPRATTHRWIPRDAGDVGYSEPLRVYAIEASSHIGPPKRFLSRFGQLLEHAPYCERDLRGPTEPLLAEDVGADQAEETEVYIRHRATGQGIAAGAGATQKNAAHLRVRN